jgi:hypothetical protein
MMAHPIISYVMKIVQQDKEIKVFPSAINDYIVKTEKAAKDYFARNRVIIKYKCKNYYIILNIVLQLQHLYTIWIIPLPLLPSCFGSSIVMSHSLLFWCI